MMKQAGPLNTIWKKLPYRIGKGSRAIKWVLAISILIIPFTLWGTSIVARQNILESLEENSSHALELHAANLRGELEKFQAIPKLLGTNQDVVAALRFPNDDFRIIRVNQLLDRMNSITGAADTYLMDITGKTIAASNWATETSFVGRNFDFRPYFIDASQGKLGRYFALGLTSKVRGYYFASPVFLDHKIVGVSVVKVNLDVIEAEWRTQTPQSLAVSDDQDVMFLTNKSEWRYHTLSVLSEDTKQVIYDSQKYLDNVLLPANLKVIDRFSDQANIVVVDTLSENMSENFKRPKKYLMQSLHMPEAGWTLHIFEDYQSVNQKILVAIIVVSLGLASLVLAIITMLQRISAERQRLSFEAQAKQALEKSAAELEQKVAERTIDLKSTNIKLEEQIDVRRQAEEHLRISQSSLLQAEKLAALGKMSAGISHELNQPLSAIRSYADNARKFLDRANQTKAQDNLVIISELTQRMGNIIAHLKMFARKPTAKIDVISLNQVIDDAMRVVVPRIEKMGIKLDMVWAKENVSVLGSNDRLHQVFINLFGNALDAMDVTDNREQRLYVKISPLEDTVEIKVRDTGKGIDEGDIAQVFDPFFTTKEIGDGLGLGLSISYSIIQDCGGQLQAYNRKEGGAEFIVTLRRAIEEA